MSEEPILRVKGVAAGKGGFRGARLAIFDDRIEVDNPGAITRGKQTVIRFDQVSQVDCKKGIGFSALTISSLGAGNVVVESLKRSEAEQARQLIIEKVAASRQPAAASLPTVDIADQLAKLAALRDSGVLTEDEFAAQKARLLG